MKALMVIAPTGFRDEELFEPKHILEQSGIEVTVGSLTRNAAKGMLGGQITPDITINEVSVEDYDTVIFVGGTGASVYWNDALAHKLIQQATSLDKIVAAICIAPVTLANAGVLEGKKATVWSSEGNQITQRGGVYTGEAVEKDGNIITASGPSHAQAFGQEIVKALMS
jgi:protease I